MEYGWIMLLILAVMGGVIAYLGDKIGSRVGKRKIKLFGMRPKYSSILITIITGVSIAAVTLGVMSVLSQNVRIALFGMHQLQLQKAELEQQLADANDRIRVTQLDLEQTQAARDDVSRQLTIVQVARDEMMARNTQLNTENKELEATQARMNHTIGLLDERIKLLNDKMTDIREGQVLFRVGEVLASKVVDANADESQIRASLGEMLAQTNTRIREQLGITNENAVVLYISQDEIDQTVQTLHAARGSKLIRLTAAGNIILGEPALVHLETFDNQLIYHKNEIVYEEHFRSSDVNGSAEYIVFRFLHEVNQKAVGKGIPPDPLTGNVGSLTATEMFDTIQRIKSCGDGDIILRAVARTDIYTAGPMNIDIAVRSYGTP